MPKLDAFTRQYIETALWSTTDDADDSGGEPLDANYSASDIAPETMELIEEDCADFQDRYAALLNENDAGQAGHDFWLSRNGHGAGFDDGDWPEHGDELQKAAQAYGEFDLYVGDNGLIYGQGSRTRKTKEVRAPRRRTPVAVDIECDLPREYRWFRQVALDQGWARIGPSGQFELTDRPENLPARFHDAVRAARCHIQVLSHGVEAGPPRVYRDAFLAAVAADDAWSAELQRQFGKKAGDVRYTKQAEGAPGSELRRLYNAKVKADKAMRGEVGEVRAPHVRQSYSREHTPRENMHIGWTDVYFYAGDIYCYDCGLMMRKEMGQKDLSGDSEYYPRGPYPNGERKANDPEHCDFGGERCLNAMTFDGVKVGVWLGNPLTDKGVKYLKEVLADPNATPYQMALHEFWSDVYADYLEAPEEIEETGVREGNDDFLAFNTTLAKLMQRLKKDAGAESVSQNYRGTGREAFRRQLWVRFKSGAVIDLWLDNGFLKFGGVVMNRPPGNAPRPLPMIPYEGKTPEEVYTEAAELLRAWATPDGGAQERRGMLLLPPMSKR